MSIQQNINATLGVMGALYSQSPIAELRSEDIERKKEFRVIDRETKNLDKLSKTFDDIENSPIYKKLTEDKKLPRESVNRAISQVKTDVDNKVKIKRYELNKRKFDLTRNYYAKYEKDIEKKAYLLAREQVNMAKQNSQNYIQRDISKRKLLQDMKAGKEIPWEDLITGGIYKGNDK